MAIKNIIKRIKVFLDTDLLEMKPITRKEIDVELQRFLFEKDLEGIFFLLPLLEPGTNLKIKIQHKPFKRIYNIEVKGL